MRQSTRAKKALPISLCMTLAAGTIAFTATAPAAKANPPAHAVAGGVTFPGPNPEKAQVKVAGDNFVLSNAVLEQRWMATPQKVELKSFVNKMAGKQVGVRSSSLVRISLSDGSEIDTDDLTRVAKPAVRELDGDEAAGGVADRQDGVAVDTPYRFTSGGDDYLLTWSAELRDGANSVEHHLTIAPESGGSLSATTVSVFDSTADGPRVWGRDDGSPIVFGENGHELGFVGLESPLSKPAAAEGTVTLGLPLASPITADNPLELSVGYGVVPPEQLRRGFEYYVERERAHERRTFLHYQSWYDLKPGAPGLVIDREGLNHAIDLFSKEFKQHGAKIDSFWVDDGWDYLRDPAVDETNLYTWDFDPTVFPNGFDRERDKIAQLDDASLSVWMSPFGGYGASKSARLALNESKPEDVRYETRSGGFDIGGERYGKRFREVAFRMMDEFNVKGFKFDGVGAGLGQTGPAAGRLGEYEALLDLMHDMREHRSDVFINITVGSWGSPYWLWYTDSVFRDGADVERAGSGTRQVQYVTGRDGALYDRRVSVDPAFPITAAMVHGFVFSDRSSVTGNKDLTDPTVRSEVENDLRNYFANGYSLQEMYVRQTLVDSTAGVPGADWFWDTLTRNAKWGRDNQDLLADNHWVSGNPKTGPYATAAWSQSLGQRGVVQVRNGMAAAATYQFDVGDAFELPADASQRYELVERDGQLAPIVAEAGGIVSVPVQPGQTLVFEAHPTDAPLTSGAGAEG